MYYDSDQNSIALVFFALWIVYSFALFKLSKRLKHPHGWLSFVPFLQMIQYLQLGRVSSWWVILFFIPSLNILFLYPLFLASREICRRCDEKLWVAILLTFVPIVNIFILFSLGTDSVHDKKADLR